MALNYLWRDLNLIFSPSKAWSSSHHCSERRFCVSFKSKLESSWCEVPTSQNCCSLTAQGLAAKQNVPPRRNPGILSHLGPQVDCLYYFFDSLHNNNMQPISIQRGFPSICMTICGQKNIFLFTPLQLQDILESYH